MTEIRCARCGVTYVAGHVCFGRDPEEAEIERQLLLRALRAIAEMGSQGGPFAGSVDNAAEIARSALSAVESDQEEAA